MTSSKQDSMSEYQTILYFNQLSAVRNFAHAKNYCLHHLWRHFRICCLMVTHHAKSAVSDQGLRYLSLMMELVCCRQLSSAVRRKYPRIHHFSSLSLPRIYKSVVCMREFIAFPRKSLSANIYTLAVILPTLAPVLAVFNFWRKKSPNNIRSPQKTRKYR